MDATLHALAGLLLKATFTVAILVLLHIYLRFVFFSPLDRILKRRYELTEGSRKAAQDSIRRAEERAAEYEAKLREARAEALREQEEAQKKWLADQDAQIRDARARGDDLMTRMRREIHEEMERAQWDLARDSETLADEICDVVLRGKAS